jgi:hypothetical protein
MYYHWPGQAVSASGCSVSGIYRPSAHEGGKIANPKHRPTLLPFGSHFYLRLSRRQGHSTAGKRDCKTRVK